MRRYSFSAERRLQRVFGVGSADVKKGVTKMTVKLAAIVALITVAALSQG